jgi:hypothetical protein
MLFINALVDYIGTIGIMMAFGGCAVLVAIYPHTGVFLLLLMLLYGLFDWSRSLRVQR